MFTGVPCVAVVVGAGVGATVVNFDGPGEGAVGAPAAGDVLPGVGLTVGFGVDFTVEPAEVPAVAVAAAAEANALAAAESVGAEAAGAGDDIGALGNELDAAAAAWPDDAALFL
jgi:hypothetical protein